MQYFVTNDSLATHASDCIAVAVFENGQLSSAAETLDKATNGTIKKIVEQGDIDGKAGQTLMIHHPDGLRCQRVLLVGCGKQGKTTENDFNSAIMTMAKVLNDSGAIEATSTLTEVEVNQRSEDWKVRQAVIMSEAALYRYTQTKSDVKPLNKPLEQLGFVGDDIAELEQAIAAGSAIAQGMNMARDLGNLPGNICTPSYLAEQAIKLGEKFDTVKTTVLEEEQMAELGMGSLLSVSRGSRQPAKLITMEYKGAGDARPIVLVGKGVTFDAGGISLKPGQAMDEMKYDMCGSASVIGTMAAVAELGLPVNLVCVVPTTENLPDGDASKPGDIVTSMSGKTIEILNTDAEGRLILCDALTYSERFNPEVVVDIATLTGAIIVALGSVTTGLMANNQELADALLQAGNDSYDRAWQLPMWDDYQKQLDSNFADFANIGGKEAGSVTAACFLSRFTEKFKWAHLDIAGTAWVSGKEKGATGRPVPLLMQFILNHIEQQ